MNVIWHNSKYRHLHIKGELHLRFQTAAEDRDHQICENFFRDSAILATIHSQWIKSVTNDSWQLYIFDKGNFIDRLARTLVRRRSRPKGKVREYATEVGLELGSNELVVDFSIEVLKEK